MAIQFLSISCPECGANLSVEEGRQQFYCTYCGAKVMMSNESEKIIRQIDEARIKEAETERMVKMKKLEMSENTTWAKKPVLIMWMILIVFLFVMSGIGFIKDNLGMALTFLNIGLLGSMGLAAVAFSGNRNEAKGQEKVADD